MYLKLIIKIKYNEETYEEIYNRTTGTSNYISFNPNNTKRTLFNGMFGGGYNTTYSNLYQNYPWISPVNYNVSFNSDQEQEVVRELGARLSPQGKYWQRTNMFPVLNFSEKFNTESMWSNVNKPALHIIYFPSDNWHYIIEPDFGTLISISASYIPNAPQLNKVSVYNYDMFAQQLELPSFLCNIPNHSYEIVGKVKGVNKGVIIKYNNQYYIYDINGSEGRDVLLIPNSILNSASNKEQYFKVVVPEYPLIYILLSMTASKTLKIYYCNRNEYLEDVSDVQWTLLTTQTIDMNNILEVEIASFYNNTTGYTSSIFFTGVYSSYWEIYGLQLYCKSPYISTSSPLMLNAIKELKYTSISNSGYYQIIKIKDWMIFIPSLGTSTTVKAWSVLKDVITNSSYSFQEWPNISFLSTWYECCGVEIYSSQSKCVIGLIGSTTQPTPSYYQLSFNLTTGLPQNLTYEECFINLRLSQLPLMDSSVVYDKIGFGNSIEYSLWPKFFFPDPFLNDAPSISTLSETCLCMPTGDKNCVVYTRGMGMFNIYKDSLGNMFYFPLALNYRGQVRDVVKILYIDNTYVAITSSKHLSEWTSNYYQKFATNVYFSTDLYNWIGGRWACNQKDSAATLIPFPYFLDVTIINDIPYILWMGYNPSKTVQNGRIRLGVWEDATGNSSAISVQTNDYLYQVNNFVGKIIPIGASRYAGFFSMQDIYKRTASFSRDYGSITLFTGVNSTLTFQNLFLHSTGDLTIMSTLNMIWSGIGRDMLFVANTVINDNRKCDGILVKWDVNTNTLTEIDRYRNLSSTTACIIGKDTSIGCIAIYYNSVMRLGYLFNEQLVSIGNINGTIYDVTNYIDTREELQINRLLFPENINVNEYYFSNRSTYSSIILNLMKSFPSMPNSTSLKVNDNSYFNDSFTSSVDTDSFLYPQLLNGMLVAGAEGNVIFCYMYRDIRED